MNKEELEESIAIGALRELCIQYDIENEEYPESLYEGLSIYNFFREIVLGPSSKVDWDIWKKICKNTEKKNSGMPTMDSLGGSSGK